MLHEDGKSYLHPLSSPSVSSKHSQVCWRQIFRNSEPGTRLEHLFRGGNLEIKYMYKYKSDLYK